MVNAHQCQPCDARTIQTHTLPLHGVHACTVRLHTGYDEFGLPAVDAVYAVNALVETGGKLTNVDNSNDARRRNFMCVAALPSTCTLLWKQHSMHNPESTAPRVYASPGTRQPPSTPCTTHDAACPHTTLPPRELLHALGSDSKARLRKGLEAAKVLQRAIVSEGGSAMLRGDFVRVHSALLVFNMADNQFPHKLLQVCEKTLHQVLWWGCLCCVIRRVLFFCEHWLMLPMHWLLGVAMLTTETTIDNEQTSTLPRDTHPSTPLLSIVDHGCLLTNTVTT